MRRWEKCILRFSGDLVSLVGDRFLGPLSSALVREQPVMLVPRTSASVAVIFRDEGEGEEVLLIRRAEREGDPWSGQVAFPGGMVSAGDKSFEETARREAAEEVGLDLSDGGCFLGYMMWVKARMRDVMVVPSVFKLARPSEIVPNREVASFEWVALGSLAAAGARSTYVLRGEGREVRFPSFVHRGLVVWGLTERILSAIIGDKTAADDQRVMDNVERY